MTIADTKTQAPLAAASTKPPARRRSLLLSPWLLVLAGQLGLTIAFFAAWEALIRFGFLKVYLYGQPSGIIQKFWKLLIDGSLIADTAITAYESVLGFAIGSFLGSLMGLALWLTPTLAAILRPFIVAINGLPKIALAPLIIVWFGIDIESKIAIAAIITFIVSLMTAYSGAMEVDNDLVRLMRSLGATPRQTFFKVVVPSTVPWIVSGLRLNVGFALIGAVVGEYIAAKKGLGFLVYYAGTLYDLNAVWVGLFMLMAVALVLDYLVTLIERRFRWN